MRRSLMTTAVAVVASFAVGMTWSWFASSSRTGGVAVVDLDEVARRLGRDAEMVQAFQGEAGRLNQALTSAQQSAVSQLEEIGKGLGDHPSEDDARNFLRVRQSAQLQLNQLRARAETQLNQHRQQLVSQFRQQAKPIVNKVAKDKGYSTIVTRNDTVVFSYDNAVDITEDVVRLMSAEMPATAKPAPAAQTQPKAEPAKPAAAPQAAAAPAEAATK